jgi:copper resistance protein C
MHRPALVVAMPLLLLFVLGAANAHAMLDHAEPRVGSKVVTVPHEVKLWFTEELEPAFSTIAVTDTSGRRVDSGKALSAET